MSIKSYIQEGSQEFHKGMQEVGEDIRGTLQKHKGKILGAIAGLSILGGAAHHHDEKKMADWREEKAHEEQMRHEREWSGIHKDWSEQEEREKRVDQGMKTPE